MRVTLDDLFTIDIIGIFILVFSFLNTTGAAAAVSQADLHVYTLHRHGFYITCILVGILINIIIAPALYYFDPRYDEMIEARSK